MSEDKLTEVHGGGRLMDFLDLADIPRGLPYVGPGSEKRLDAVFRYFRDVPEFWPIEGPAEPLHQGEGHYVTKHYLLVSNEPPALRRFSQKLWMPGKDRRHLGVHIGRRFLQLRDQFLQRFGFGHHHPPRS